METKARKFPHNVMQSSKFILFAGATVNFATWTGLVWGVVAIIKLF